ncbi:MAG: ATP synthase F1 complex subunit delta [Candidatus Westeberhardia cardiocondylae]|nr:ATP synthase F1 complex subunit delta [Candidatus Westeberhardia cardiocondylae]
MHNITIAAPYAKAVFELSIEQNNVKEWQFMLEFSSQISQNANIRFLLFPNFMSSKRLSDIFLDMCGSNLNIFGKNFIRVMAENNRLLLLPYVLKKFIFFRLKYENIKKVKVISAFPLTERQKRNITLFMKKKLLSKILLNCKIDKSIISGIIIQWEDFFIDYSVFNRIKCLESFLQY